MRNPVVSIQCAGVETLDEIGSIDGIGIHHINSLVLDSTSLRLNQSAGGLHNSCDIKHFGSKMDVMKYL